FLMRLCGAAGLHHMIYPMFWFTELGGVEVVNGVSVAGAQKIFKTYILKFNVPTPGRGEDEVAPEAAITTKDSLKDDSIKIIE
ncbi:hypothetical protein PT041_08850, partial [Erysipelothrix rhusiopathiae]|nr:hypothetical protein [Erysipelothrix rhusiopathiae]